MELGKKIKQLRFKAGLTQEQLAEKLGIGAQSVSKWENAVAMQDISTLPLLSEIFGVSIDELFDLSNEQRFHRIENRLDLEADLPQDVFMEYEEFLKAQKQDAQHRKQATDLLAYLYWHRMDSYARKTKRLAEEAVRLAPAEKGCQWMLQKAAGHAAWDWNVSNHTEAINFYRELTEANPDSRMCYYYLLDNLIADHRADEAEAVLARVCALKDTRPVINQVYRAHIALARFDEPAADRIIEELLQQIQPHQIYVAADLADPHGTHRTCTDAVLAAIDEEKKAGAEWLSDCRVWMYRGAWAEWEIEDIEMCVPMSPEELHEKRNAILRHQSQMEGAPFLGNDDRLFWQRAEDRNRATAKQYDDLGLACYEAMEAFVEYKF
jgi:transcriptional regulator with XRE-family HTH domain/LmbE family N-acetylglucosaminyl deacetylase